MTELHVAGEAGEWHSLSHDLLAEVREVGGRIADPPALARQPLDQRIGVPGRLRRHHRWQAAAANTQTSFCARLRASLRARRIASARSRARFSDGFS